jgi:hypothetical protein
VYLVHLLNILKKEIKDKNNSNKTTFVLLKLGVDNGRVWADSDP